MALSQNPDNSDEVSIETRGGREIHISWPGSPNSSSLLNEDQYRGFIENLPVLFYAVDPAPPYTPIYVSPAFRRFGYPMQDWLQDPDMWLKVLHPEDRDWVFKRTRASTSSGEEVDYEYRIVDAAGMIHWVHDRGCLIRNRQGEVVCREGVIIDITDRKLAEEEIRLTQDRFRNIFDNASDIIYIHDLEGNYLSINDAGERVFGYTREETLQMNMAQVAVPEQLDTIKQKLAEKSRGEVGQTSYEVDCIRKDGRRITLEVNSSVVLKDGKPAAIQGIARDVTERKRNESAIRESEERYRELFQNANDLIYIHDLDGNFTSLNRAGERITGYTHEEAVTMNVSQVVAPEYLHQAKRKIAGKVNGDGTTAYELEIIAKDGTRVSLELSTRLITVEGKPVAIQGIGRDITERKRAEEEIKASEQRYRQLGEGILHHVWTARPDGLLDYVNARTLEYFGRSREQVLGDGWRHCVHPDDIYSCLRRWSKSLASGEPYEAEFRLRRHDGQYRWHVAKATAGHDSFGNISKWFGTNTDIHEQKESEEKLNYYARHDPLTDLPNRPELMNYLEQAIERCRENSKVRFAVLFLDLDRFKVINDSLGHAVGDKLLVAIAGRLKATLRPGDIVARLGGDEFTILLNRTGKQEEVSLVVERIQARIAEPFMIDNYEVFTTASVGVIVSNELDRTPDEYLRDADAAMYRAKESGKARYEIFDSEMHVRNLNLLQVETDLRHALERNELEVHYQPIVELTTGVVREFEALIRWRHPRRGLVSPAEFVDVAEETGLIVPIGNWVIETACKHTAQWQEQVKERLSISVNLSARQLMHPSLLPHIEGVLSDTGLSPRQLNLEVTESTVMEYRELAHGILDTLDRLGVNLSTDDFGTGYSSLSYLQMFPFDRLKIDRSFVDRIGKNRKSDAIVKTILMLGSNLGMEVVAEGIETVEQLQFLQDLGCGFGQGYYFSRPVEADQAGKLIAVNDPQFSVPVDEMVELAGIQ